MNFDFASGRASEDWVTNILTRNGYLETGDVVEVIQRKAQVGPGISATFYSLDLRYSRNSSGVRPNRVLMKVAKSMNVEAHEDSIERATAWMLLPQTQRDAIRRKEPVFYESVRGTSFTLPLVTCYGSEINEANQHTCVLLEDLSDSHFQPPWPIPAEAKHCGDTVDALAKLHGYWWESRQFGSSDFPFVTVNEIDEIVEVYQKSYSQFSSFLGDRLSDERRSAYRDALDQLPGLLKSRMSNQNKLTLAHGDAHHANVLLPKSGERVVVFDWATWHIDTGAHDLAYLMGIQWFSEHRRRQEKALLDRYQKRINALGIQYSWDELTFDYRLSVIRHLFTPVLFSSFIAPGLWWPHLDRVFCAFDDWNCVEMLS